jgi:hypothetical protein
MVEPKVNIIDVAARAEVHPPIVTTSCCSILAAVWTTMSMILILLSVLYLALSRLSPKTTS